MEAKSIVLKLFLDSLGVSSDIASVDDRKRVQKAIYLGQLTGVDLGYRYSWYLKGPYSTSLTRDYYNLAEEIAAGSDDHQAKELKPALKQKLEAVKPLMSPPAGIEISQENWLELLASYHFLTNVSGKTKQGAIEVLQAQKPHVASYVDIAEKKLKEFAF